MKKMLWGAGAPAVLLKTIRAPFVLCAFLCGLFLLSGCAGVTEQSPQISVVPSSLTFGNVVVGQKGAQTVQVSNIGRTNLSITGVSLAGSGFSLSPISVPFQLSPGTSKSFTVTFTAATTSLAKGTLTITSDDPASPLSVAMQGIGESASASWQMVPTSLSFPTLALQSTQTLPGTIKNTGNVSITVNGVTVSNPEWSTTGLSGGTSISPGQQLAFNVTFRPTVSGNATGSIQVTASGISSPLTMNLAGIGSNSATLQHKVTLTWNPSSSTVAGYHIYRGSTTGGPYSLLNSTLDLATSYVDSSVVSGSQYFYVTTAVDATGAESPFSNEVAAMIPNP